MATKRKGISKKTRFEVFKRDSFACQYCGQTAPQVILVVDHIHPVIEDGDNNILNLITACFDCNAGKGKRLLSDDSVVQRQKQQLDELQERREQLEMMLEWRNALRSINDDALDIAIEAREDTTPGWSVSENGRKDIAKLVKKFGLPLVLEAIDIAAEQYLYFTSDGLLDEESVQTSFKKIGGICRTKSAPEWKQELYYLRGILRKRLSYFNDWQGFQCLENAYNKGVSLEELQWIATNARNWTHFKEEIEDSIQRESEVLDG